MDPAYEKKGVHYPRLTSGEMNDLLIYLDNLVGIRSKEPKFELVDWRFRDAPEFQSLQCESCHRGKHSLDKRADPISLAEVQAMMWNHVLTTPRATAKVNYDEMLGWSVIVGPWSLAATRHRGEVAFAEKGVRRLPIPDRAKGAPILSERDSRSGVPDIRGLAPRARHASRDEREKSLAWPRIGRSEIADV